MTRGTDAPDIEAFLPRRMLLRVSPTPHAETSRSTSPGPGLGTGSATGSRGPPHCRSSNARIVSIATPAPSHMHGASTNAQDDGGSNETIRSTAALDIAG